MFGARKIIGTNLCEKWRQTSLLEGSTMNIQIFGTKKSFDTKKAQRYFKERRIPFQFINLAEVQRFDALLENQQVLREPIVRNGRKATVGYEPDVWKSWE